MLFFDLRVGIAEFMVLFIKKTSARIWHHDPDTATWLRPAMSPGDTSQFAKTLLAPLALSQASQAPWVEYCVVKKIIIEYNLTKTGYTPEI